MNAAKFTLTATVLAAALGLALGLMSTPAAAHCAGKHVGDHPHCAPADPIEYTAFLTGAFAFGSEEVPIVVTPNNRETELRSDDTITMLRTDAEALGLQSTWDQVFEDECPELLGVSRPVASFFAGRDHWLISTSDDAEFDDVVMVRFQKVVPVHGGDGGSHAEVNVQFRSFATDGNFLPAPTPGNQLSNVFTLTRGGINGSSVRGVHPRESCQQQGEGSSEIFDLLPGGELMLTITASAP